MYAMSHCSWSKRTSIHAATQSLFVCAKSTVRNPAYTAQSSLFQKYGGACEYRSLIFATGWVYSMTRQMRVEVTLKPPRRSSRVPSHT